MGRRHINRLWYGWEDDEITSTREITDDTAREIFLSSSYPVKCMRFDALKTLCFDKLWINKKKSPNYIYRKAIIQYFTNSSKHIMQSDDFESSNNEEIDEFWKNDKLFISVIARINNLTEQEILKFLKEIKRLNNTPTKMTDIQENPIIIMNRVLSSL